MKTIAIFSLIAAALFAALILFGCHGSSTPINNDPDPPNPPPNNGRVTDEYGNGIPGINVMTTDGTNIWNTVTDANGYYLLPNVTPGSRVIAFYGNGWISNYLGVVVGAAGLQASVTLDPQLLASPVVKPGLNLNAPVISQVNGTADVSGAITNLDIEHAVIIVNGSATLLTTNNGNLDTLAILQPGNNTLHIWAVNAVGSTLSTPMVVNWTPTEAVFFRVTLTWDGTGDIDLHTWDPNAQHSLYNSKIIPTGLLDVDNTVMDGPENFTCTTLANGRFRIGVNSYNSPQRNATIRVAVLSGPNAGQRYTFGPYLFRGSNWNEGYPITGNTASWWRPCDITVAGNIINVVPPDNTQLQRSIQNERMLTSWKK